MAQSGTCRCSAVTLVFLPLALLGWGGVDVGAVVGLCGPGGGWDSTTIGCTDVETTWGIASCAGGSRYHTRIPNVKLGTLKVAITSLLKTPGGGKRKGIIWTGDEPK